jgi:hypothetical protein
MAFKRESSREPPHPSPDQWQLQEAGGALESLSHKSMCNGHYTPPPTDLRFIRSIASS